MTTWQQYELVCTIGKGHYGTVTRARHRKLGLLVALKSVLNKQTELSSPAGTLSSSSSYEESSSSATTSSSNKLSPPSSSERGNSRARDSGNSCRGSGALSMERRVLIHEARVLASLSHPCLVSLVEICVDSQGELALALEDLGGMTLSGLVGQRQRQQQDSDCDDGLCDCLVGCVANHVACGLRYLHSRGYLHRDVKPDNIMVENTSHCFPHAKLIDLGLSIAYSEHDLPNTSNSRAGTRAYMAPELMLSDTLYGPKIDLFSLGACIYFALLGQEPFAAFTTKKGVLSTTSIFGLNAVHEDGLDTLRPEVKDVLLATLVTRPEDRCSVQQLLRTSWIQTCAVAGSFVRHARTALPELASRLQLQHVQPCTVLRCLRPNCDSPCSRLSSNINLSSCNSGTASLDEVSSITDSPKSGVSKQSSSDSVLSMEEACNNEHSVRPLQHCADEPVVGVTPPLQPPDAPPVVCNGSTRQSTYDPFSKTEGNNKSSSLESDSSCSDNVHRSTTKITELTPSAACTLGNNESSSESVCRVLGLKDAACRSLSLTSTCSCPDGRSVPRDTDTVETVARLLQQDTYTVLRSLECQPWGQTAGVYNLLSMEKHYIKFSPPVAEQELDCCAVDDVLTDERCYTSSSRKIMNKTL